MKGRKSSETLKTNAEVISVKASSEGEGGITVFPPLPSPHLHPSHFLRL